MQLLRRPAFTATALIGLLLLFVAGCAPKDKSEIVVAKVEDRPITLAYFERKMNTMDPQYLPENIDTQEGREELLEIMIDKEVMALKAEELGMDADGAADKQADVVAQLKAVTRMRTDVVKPAQSPTEDQIYDYYENFARKLKVSYMLFDHEEQAREAKALVEGGEDWATVAERLQAGDPGPTGDWTLVMKYGTVADDLEKVVFDLPVGEVSDPIDSIYGWFLIRVDEQTMERVPPLDAIRDKIRASVVKQNSQLAIKKFVEEVFDEYGFELNEEALQKIYDALPPDPELTPPPKPEDLQPLNLDPKDLDMVLMKYGDEVWDLRRYADFYDNSSVFGRPRREQRLGSLRRMLKEQAVRDLMPVVARDRGYMDDPEVQDEYKLRKEQAMVTKLHDELIRGQVKVTPEEVEQYWAEHSQDFIVPERRQIKAIISSTETKALAAQVEAKNGASWIELVEKYCDDLPLKQHDGDLGTVSENDTTEVAQHAFMAGGEGAITYPARLSDGTWLVLKIEKVLPREEKTFEQAKVQIGRIIESQKEEELFQQKVAEWKEQYSIERHPEHLMKAVYEPKGPNNRITVNTGVQG